jgi:hypothetical protein
MAASFTASETFSSTAIFSSSRAIWSAAASSRCLALALTAVDLRFSDEVGAAVQSAGRAAREL